MELVVLGIIVAGLGVLLAWEQVAQRAHVGRVRVHQQGGGRAFQAGPIGTIGYADRLSATPERRVFGALGVVADALVFKGHRTDVLDRVLPLDALRWIGLRTRVKTAWSRRIETPQLVIHAEHEGRWQVLTFIEGDIVAFAAALGELAGLPVHDMGEAFEDFGPAPALYLRRTAGDAWEPAIAGQPDAHRLQAGWEADAPLLYLAPDRLLFDGTQAIPLRDIREVAVYESGEAPAHNPFAVNLLCLTVGDDSATGQILGFLVPNAGDWAGILEARLEQLPHAAAS